MRADQNRSIFLKCVKDAWHLPAEEQMRGLLGPEFGPAVNYGSARNQVRRDESQNR
jgi:hypothetical protein